MGRDYSLMRELGLPFLMQGQWLTTIHKIYELEMRNTCGNMMLAELVTQLVI